VGLKKIYKEGHDLFVNIAKLIGSRLIPSVPIDYRICPRQALLRQPILKKWLERNESLTTVVKNTSFGFFS
jgi:hypothetical protein